MVFISLRLSRRYFYSKFTFHAKKCQKNKGLLGSYPHKIGYVIIAYTSNPPTKISMQMVSSYEDWGQHPWEENRMKSLKKDTFNRFNYFDYKDA